jgi:class 3 adenylate cyclase/pimeloyl-ACP methyl ester carboxylesterase
MVAPPIQYCKTSDGVSIAYYAAGAGEPLLVTPPLGPSHLTLERRSPELEAWYQHITAHRTLIRWDPRLHGLSERKVEADASPEAVDRDIEAVLAALDFESVDMVGSGPWNFVALGLAARSPQRVRKLGLLNPLVRWADYYPGRQGRAVLDLARVNWTLYTETASHGLLGWSDRSSHDYALLMRESILQEDFLERLLPAWQPFDASPLLQSVRAETFVVYSSAEVFGNLLIRSAQEIAASIPGTKVMDTGPSDESHLRLARVLRPIDEFLGIPEDEHERGDPDAPSGTAIILVLDIAGSTELTTKLGDTAYREKEREVDASLRSAIREAGGAPVEGKVLGDGVMATFASAKDAIDAALRCQTLGVDAGLPLHAGIHAGDVTREGNNVHGGAVQVAARIADASAASETLVSSTVRDLARTSAGVAFEDRGERELKGVSEPVRVFAVRAALRSE